MKVAPAPRVKVDAEHRWLERVLSGTFGFLQDASVALQSRLGPDNANVEIRSVSLLDQTPIILTTQTLRGPVLSVALLRADINDFVSLAWRPIDHNRTEVEIFADSGPTDAVPCLLMLIGN